MNFLGCWNSEGNGEPDQVPLCGYRHLQTLLYFLLFTYTYCMRTVLSVAIVAMNNNGTSSNADIPTYNWTNQSVVLSAFFWGYVVFQIPAAQIGKNYGPKWILVCCAVTDSVSCILIPQMAEQFGSVGVMGCRFFQGLAQGGLSPLVHMLLGSWAPPGERSRLVTFSYSGALFGNIISLPVTGLLCSSWLGWPSSFYLFGGLGLKWALLWSIFGCDRPGVHGSISDIEKSYIQSSLGQEIHKVHRTPWKAILGSAPFWAVTLAFVGANWGSTVLLTQTPTYLFKILGYDIKSNSLLTAAIYLAMWIATFFISPVCDWMINRGIVSRGTARKIFNSIGTLLPAVFLTAMGFLPKEQANLSVLLLILSGCTLAGGYCGFQVNHIDLSPNHSGIIMSMTNCSTSIFSIISPLVVQVIVTDQANQHQWRIIFIITASVYAMTNFVFVAFASGRVQPWNEIRDVQEEDPQTSVASYS